MRPQKIIYGLLRVLAVAGGLLIIYIFFLDIPPPILQNFQKNLKEVDEDTEQMSSESCSEPETADTDMLKLYNNLSFENVDGGVWKQGWNINYSTEQWNPQKKLKVFLVPHSHNDPGWLETFENYYKTKTKSILTNLVNKLTEDSRRTFIWAEVSYLSLWWADQKADMQDKMRKLILNAQLEIVTGGWVMNDEANSHYWATVQQLTEGHEWLQKNVGPGVKPNHSWSIDPFGYSASSAYILKKSKMEAALIHRVHYIVKKRFARERGLEFRWRQTWCSSQSELFTHVTPFYGYDVLHTCGPDPSVCCQFDFKRLKNFGCPWGTSPTAITKDNVRQRAEMILDQYRKKATLYRTNSVLVPLGDDFRYDEVSEWDDQFNNYQMIFDHLNSRDDLHVEARFATLADYFKAVKEELGDVEKLPSLSGDFFVYADKYDHYWSGYFTSRPYYKRLDRVLIGYLRSAEVIFSLAWGHTKKGTEKNPWILSAEAGLHAKLTMARQANALFQHHDGVTGTAKDPVMVDYGNKMIKAINATQHVLQLSAQYLLSSQKEPKLNAEAVYLYLDDAHPRTMSFAKRMNITFGEGLPARRVVVFNSLNRARVEPVRLRVAHFNVKVTDSDNQIVPCQVQPIFKETATMLLREYELIFLASVPPFSLSTFLVSWSSSPEERAPLASVSLGNNKGNQTLKAAEGFEQLGSLPEGEAINVTNQQFSAVFSSHGFLQSVTMQGVTVPVKLEFVTYGTKSSGRQSGAYLFMPDGPAKLVSTTQPPLVRVMRGPVATQIEVLLPHMVHTATIFNCSGEIGSAIDIVNLVDLKSDKNTELAMRLTSEAKSNDTYYTDLNAFQMMERQRLLKKLPLQAHFFPMAGMAHIEDSETRVSVASGQPLGAASLQSGQLEVMQDRRLFQDDDRGIHQGVQDNKLTPNVFRLIIERKSCHKDESPKASLSTHLNHQSLMWPLVHFIAADDPSSPLKPSFSVDSEKADCGLHVVNLRTNPLERPRAGLVLHQLASDECLPPPPGLQCRPQMSSTANVSALFPGFFGTQLQKASLTFLHKAEQSDITLSQTVCPNELAAFLLG